MKKITLIFATLVLVISSQLNAATVNLADYLVTASLGRSWSYIYTHDTIQGAYGNAIAGDEITVTDQPFSRFMLSFFPPVVETGSLYLLEPSTPNSGNIYLYFEHIDSLTVPAGTFNNVLAVSALDDYFAANSFNGDPRLAIDPTITAGVTDVSWYAAGIGEIKFLGVGASDGSIDGGFELTSYVSAVPVPAAVWLFGSGLVGLMGVARRKKV